MASSARNRIYFYGPWLLAKCKRLLDGILKIKHPRPSYTCYILLYYHITKYSIGNMTSIQELKIVSPTLVNLV